MKWLDSFSWPMLLIMGSFLLIAPISPEPHIVEKITMLVDGELSKPMDIFDLFLHSAPLLLMSLKLFRQSKQRASN